MRHLMPIVKLQRKGALDRGRMPRSSRRVSLTEGSNNLGGLNVGQGHDPLQLDLGFRLIKSPKAVRDRLQVAPFDLLQPLIDALEIGAVVRGQLDDRRQQRQHGAKEDNISKKTISQRMCAPEPN